MKTYLDSCILIYRLEGAPEFAGPVAEAIRAATGVVFCVTDLVRLECLVGPIRADDADRRATFEAHFDELTCLALSRGVFELAAELRARHRLKTPDALHAAAAITHGCDEFWTNDHRLASIKNRIRIRVLP
jgi:uncharacterized protein